MTIVVPGHDVVAVLRRCRECGDYKALEHYLIHKGRRGATVVGSVKVCAGCRRLLIDQRHNRRRYA